MASNFPYNIDKISCKNSSKIPDPKFKFLCQPASALKLNFGNINVNNGHTKIGCLLSVSEISRFFVA